MLNRAWRNLALFACLLAFSFPRLAQGQQKLGPGRKTLPLLCFDGSGVDRDAIHAKTRGPG
jgi:hypothetical protein